MIYGTDSSPAYIILYVSSHETVFTSIIYNQSIQIDLDHGLK